jgi:hypothetical protein
MNRRIAWMFGLFSLTAVVVIACINKTPSHKEALDINALTKNQPEAHGTIVKPGDIQMTHPLNQQWVSEGKNIYDVKCQPCHKLNDEKLIGPGWKGVTHRRQPDWILNMITNVDIMLEKDIEAQKLLEECIVRMPNQNLNLDEARKVLEFQRSNDGEK